ncbi:MAG: aromatic aminobenezylarsenical efflux permease ArsG family transporter [Prevotella sp.]
MDIIQRIMCDGQLPVITSFLLGLIVAVHPCPLATNIAAMGYIARNTGHGKQVFASGLYYTLGRITAYSLLGAVLYFIYKSGADILHLGDMFGLWGEKILAPVLIVIGLYFIFQRFLHKKGEHCANVNAHAGRFHGRWGSFLLGVILALSFCPESAIVYFGMLMPLSAKADGGVFLPIVFSIATAIPVVLLAWTVSFGLSDIIFKERMFIVQRWINTVCALLFIAAGLYMMFE